MTDPSCPFCRPDASRIFHVGKRVLGLWDGLKARFWKPSPAAALILAQNRKPEPAKS